MSDGVGRVIGHEHTSTREFRVVLNEDEYLQLDDLVVVRTQVPKAGEVRTYGVVTESEAVFEGASYESDTMRIAAEGTMPGGKVRSARVSVTRVDPELWVSPDPGVVVDRATGAERDKALYADEMDRPLPVGLGRDGLPLFVDLDFFDGRKGGHMSISGISGVATKTSFACSSCECSPPGETSWATPARTSGCSSSMSRVRTCCGWTSRTGSLVMRPPPDGGHSGSTPAPFRRCRCGPRRDRALPMWWCPTRRAARMSRCSPGLLGSSSTRAC